MGANELIVIAVFVCVEYCQERVHIVKQSAQIDRTREIVRKIRADSALLEPVKLIDRSRTCTREFKHDVCGKRRL